MSKTSSLRKKKNIQVITFCGLKLEFNYHRKHSLDMTSSFIQVQLSFLV